MNSSPKTSYSLLGKLQDRRNVEAWHEFTAIYQPVILRVAKSRGLQHADAVDVTQNVLTRVATAIEQFDPDRPGATFRGWLYRLTRNLVVDFLRDRNRNPLAGAAEFEERDGRVDPSKAEAEEFYREYQRQVFVVASEVVRTEVNERTWQAFWASEIEQKPVSAVAKQLGMSSGAIYVARSRVLARLKRVAESQINESLTSDQDMGAK